MNKTNKTKHVLYLGCPGFPYGLAEMEKIILISKSLVLKNNHVTVISKTGIHNQNDHPDLKVSGNYQDISYVYASGECFYNKSFIKRNFLKVKGTINEVLLLRKRKKNELLDYAILSTKSFTAILFYAFWSKVFGFKTILNYVEFYSGIKKKWYKIGQRLNDKLFDKYASSIVDAVLPISEFIITHIKGVAPNKKYLKVPGLTEFERYDNTQIEDFEKYFLFCGAAGYKEVIQFIIDSFELLADDNMFLYLVINGNASDMGEVKNYINESSKKNKIKFLSKLTQKELFFYYKNAAALLIPLRPTFQDIARFPHKFGEYLASANPVITTNYGEVKHYFKDMEHMLIAEEYDINKFAAKMQFVIDNPDFVMEIGLKGRSVANEIFNYKNKANEIDEFLGII